MNWLLKDNIRSIKIYDKIYFDSRKKLIYYEILLIQLDKVITWVI